jgi:hypothetical protein
VVRIDTARRGAAPTLCDEIVEVIRGHGPGGLQGGDGIELDLV